jgi:hypothetical protein
MPGARNQFVLMKASKNVAAIGGRLMITMCEIAMAK